jgi:hypothetical protein
VSQYALATTVHDPQERLLAAWHPGVAQLGDLYIDKVAACSDTTSAATIYALCAAGFRCVASPTGLVGSARRAAVQACLQSDASDWIHYVDSDRLLHWLRAFPDELAEILVPEHTSDFVALARTPRALATHPPAQVVTETASNMAFQAFAGLDSTVDLVSGSFIISRRAAELVVMRSSESTNATDLEWPGIVFCELHTGPEVRTVEGLEFETADYYQREIEAAGSYERWLKMTCDCAENWARRARLSADSVASLTRLHCPDV